MSELHQAITFDMMIEMVKASTKNPDYINNIVNEIHQECIPAPQYRPENILYDLDVIQRVISIYNAK